jgi:dinuclear metal center YbgI/SA1388 family protein
VATVSEITRSLAEHTKPETAATWDPVGLQLGDPAAEVGTVAVCHEVTEEVVARLEDQPVDLLVTYHPLLFSPVNRLVSGRSAESRAFRLIRAGVSLLVTHTDFDAMEGGAADALAKLYRLRHVVPFGGDDETGAPAIGRVGDFDGNLGVLDAMTSDAFGSNGLRVNGDRSGTLAKVAVVPGSGSEFIDAAASLADALVTGDVSHHRAVRAADLGLAIVDPGHIATERPGMRVLVRLMSEIAGDVTDLTGIDPTTWS